MVSKRHLRNLEIVLANGAILQWATRRCFMCGGCGHGHWECSNKYAIPYEEWAMIHEEEKKSSCDQFVNEEDVFNILVKDEDDVFVEEPASNAQEESHYNDSFLIHDDFVEEGMIVPVNGLETALNNVANMMANIMERLDKALSGPSGTRDISAGQPRQALRTASSPILQELHDPEEVERERQAIDRRRAEELARNNKANEGRVKDVSRIICGGNENPRGSVLERISHQKAHVIERLGKNPEKAPQGWIRPQASQVASSNREPRQRNGRGGSQVLVRSLRNLEEDEVQGQARVPAPCRLGPPVPETVEFQDLRQQIQEMQRKINKGREHINSYVQVMIAVDASDALMCRCFLQTLDSKVADWVNHIPAGSIRTWDELGLRFLEHFAGNCRPKKHFTHLASVRQKHGESLKNFLIRWRKESREVEGTDDKSRLAMFTAALQDGLLHTDLTTHPPDTFDEAMVRAGQYVTLEERKEEKKEKTPKEEEKTGNKKPFKNKKQGFPDGLKGASPGTSEKHKSANPVFTLPVAEVMAHAAQQGLMTYPTYSQKVCNVEDTGKWCAYHRKNDHNTEDCYTLKNEMARLIRRGHLKKFVEDGDTGNPGNAQNGKRRDKEVAQAEAREKRHIGLEGEEEDSEPAPHRQKRHHGCNFIIGGNTGGDSATSRKKWANAAMVNKVLVPEGKKLKTEPIVFSNADLLETGVPHRDALVITIDIMDLLIHKTLVDTGSSVNIMYMDTYKALGDTKATRKLDMEFVVVGIISNTNIILGRPGLEDLECVISPRHLCIKFPTPHGVGISRGSQRVSRAWYLKATKQPVKYDTQVGEVTAQLLRAKEKRPRVEVAGDIEEVELEPGTPGRLVRIGKGLGAELRSRVISVLRRFRRVFAWGPADMPGLDHMIAVHCLNVLPDAKPVKQKRRHLSQEKRDLVKKEVATLQSIGHIWEECQEAFEELMRYLASPPVLFKPEPGDVLTLYLAIADCPIGTVIVREEHGAQHPVYYVSKTLRDAELRYSRLEKAMLAVFWTAKGLTPYFQAHRIVVLTNEPLASLTRSPEASARMTKWAIFISQYNMEFRPRPSIKGQALADFQVECTAREMTRTQVETRVEKDWWVMSIDGSSGSRSCGAGIVLITPEKFRIYYAIRFQFRVSNNEAEYEALINGLKILSKMGVSRVQVYSDSRLVVGQITGEFEAKEERMKRYWDLSLEMLGRFEFKLEHIPRAQNAEADVLSKLSVELPEYISKLATVEELVTPSLNSSEVIWVSADPPEWLDRLAKYIEDGEAPEDPQEAHLLQMRAPTCKKGYYPGIFLANDEEGLRRVCTQVPDLPTIPEYTWEASHDGYMPISSVIPFSRWGIDIVGALPKGAGQARWIVVAIDYFTKWVEAEPLARITRRQMIDFVGTNILCRTIIDGIKKKLLSEGSKWVDELPRILWTYRRTPRRATGDTPFGLAYGFEARAPAEVAIPTRREMEYDPEVNEKNQAVELNFVEERRDEARIRAKNYRRQVKSYFDNKVKPRAFQVGDYILRKREKSQPTKGGKLAKKYEGPYIIKAVVRPGTYKLVTPKGKEIDRTWNVEHLVKFYQ
ncbi:unnamed protein product [Cuscuta campestris]|uniref:RNase H type-1 domain-containing protein n=1 Tax=Cuscuta campestris TaxID=132261 RepID=A0A484LHW0_9ASTE|nr:unnamed protein product [Cuscuta campestris]